MNDHKSLDRNCASLSYIFFSRKGQWPTSHRQRSAPNGAGSNTPNLSFCHWLFCTYKDQKTYRCQSRAQVACKLFSGSRRGKMPWCQLASAGWARKPSSHRGAPTLWTELWHRAELTSQPAASKGEFCLSGPCPCFWGRAPASSLVCSLLSLLWAMSRRWMWGFSSCFALSKMHRAVYDPLN